MKKRIRFYRKIISILLSIMIIHSMAFSGVKAFASWDSGSTSAMTLKASTTNWTNGTVTITANVLNDSKYIKKPDGTIVNAKSTTYVVSNNGSYTFKTGHYEWFLFWYWVDDDSQTIKINNIDTIVPTLQLTKTISNGIATITATASDSSSGVKSITKPDGTSPSGTSTTYIASANGTYTFTAIDNAGNSKSSSIAVSEISEVSVANEPSFTVSMDSVYAPSNPSVGQTITFNGTIQPNDFQIPVPSKEIVLVLDSSGSMENNSKLDKLKVAAKNFITRMSTVQNLKIAIVDFDTKAVIRSDLIDSSNVNTLNSCIDNLVAGGGTNTGEGLRQGAYILSKSSDKTASKTIVFMSDGQPTYYYGKNVTKTRNGSTYTYSDSGFYDDISTSNIGTNVDLGGSGSDDSQKKCLDYATVIGAKIKSNGYNAFSIGYGLSTDPSGTAKMQQIQNSMSSVGSNFFASDTNSIDAVFNSIADKILATYPITNVKFNFITPNNNILSVDGNTIDMPSFNYRISSQTSSSIKYKADPVPFTIKIKSNIAGNNMPVFTGSTIAFPWASKTISANVPTKSITVINSAVPIQPVISGNPPNDTFTKNNVTITINYSNDSTTKKYRINGGSWQNYTSSFEVAQNCIIDAQGINSNNNSSLIASYTVSNINTVEPVITVDKTNVTKDNITVNINYSNDSTIKKYRIDGGDWQDYTGNFQVGENCVIEAYGKGDNKNQSDIVEYDVNNIDTTAPTLTLTKSTANGKTTISAEATDSGSGVAGIINQNATDEKAQGTVTRPTNSIINDNGMVTNSDGTLVTDSTITYTVSSDGTYQFTATDNAGNVTTQSINIDTTGPTLTLTQSKTNGKVTISAEAKDNGSGVAAIVNRNDTDGKTQGTVTRPADSVINDDGLVTNSDGTLITDSTIIYTVNSDGTYQFTAIDNVGNETTQSINISDPTKTKPDKPVITSDPTTQTTGKVTVTISYSSDSVTKKYRINDGTTTGDWQTYSGPFEVSKNCTIEAKGIDSASTESDIASYDINNIVAAPNVPVINVSPTAFTNDKDIVTITYSDDSTIKQYRIKTGTTTGDWQTYTDPFDVTENCTIEAKGTNQYHIESQTAIKGINNIDKIAPTGPTISLNNNNQVMITPGVDNDGGSGVKEVKYKIYSGSSSDDNQTWTTYQNSFDPNMQVFTVQAKTIDKAGNESSVVTQTFDMASIIIKHGIYDVKSNQNDYININNKVSNGIPISIAMVINAKAFNPTIDLNIGDTSKISDQNINSGIDVKQYEISNGTIGSLINEKYLGINNSSISIGSSDGFVMSEGHEYIIIYTITPKGSANDTIDMTATVRNTSNSNRLELKIQDMPDLF